MRMIFVTCLRVWLMYNANIVWHHRHLPKSAARRYIQFRRLNCLQSNIENKEKGDGKINVALFWMGVTHRGWLCLPL